MPKFKDLDGTESTHSLDCVYSGLDVPIMRTPRPKKVFTKTSEPPHRSTRQKKVVSGFDYNDYVAYHYAFMMELATIWEPGIFFEAAKDLPWVKTMNEEM